MVPDRAAAVRGRHGGHAGRRGGRRCSSWTGRSRWSAWRSSRACSLANFWYARRMSPRISHAQQLRAELSAAAHESFDGALVVKTMGRESHETERFAARATELRDAMIRVGRVRGLFDPLLDALPSLGTLAVLVVGGVRLRPARSTWPT